MQRRFLTERVNLCHQHQERASKTQKFCITSYCKAVLDPLEPAKQLKIKGQFQNPIKAERKKGQDLKKDYLLRFLPASASFSLSPSFSNRFLVGCLERLAGETPRTRLVWTWRCS